MLVQTLKAVLFDWVELCAILLLSTSIGSSISSVLLVDVTLAMHSVLYIILAWVEFAHLPYQGASLRCVSGENQERVMEAQHGSEVKRTSCNSALSQSWPCTKAASSVRLCLGSFPCLYMPLVMGGEKINCFTAS